MRDWRYDFVVIETGNQPMIDVRVDAETMERLEEPLEGLPDDDELLPERTKPRRAC